jgi:hypothetical protein
MSEDLFIAMQNDSHFKTDLFFLRMIKNDILSSSLKLEIDSIRDDLNEELYEFDLNDIILEMMGFSQKEIDNEISLKYYFQTKSVLEEMRFKKMSRELLNERAMKVYYELKKLKSSL